MIPPDDGCDIVVVGSGAAGLVAAIAARQAGLRPLIVEKAASWGGTSAISGGVVWAPGATLPGEPPQAQDAGARDYLAALVHRTDPGDDLRRIDAFLAAAPRMVDHLSRLGMIWRRDPHHPDYYPDVPGSGRGRGIGGAIFDANRLGSLKASQRAKPSALPAFDIEKSGTLARAYRGRGPFLTAAGVVARHRLRKLFGQEPVGLGRALTGRLMEIAAGLGIPLRLGCRLTNLRVDAGRVVGVEIEGAGARRWINAPAGVILASGGFARNAALREQHQGLSGSWSAAPPDDTGDALPIAQAVGAMVTAMDGAWWQPTVMTALGPIITLGERALPGAIIVDDGGRRYMNEAQNYMAGGRAMIDRGAALRQHWLICDDGFFRRYVVRTLSDRTLRERSLAEGLFRRAATVRELALLCDLPAETLEGTVARFNDFAASGLDEDFGRGASEYDRHWADPAHRPNPSLGSIVRAPFWAAPIRPGDLGTHGGLATNACAQVLDTGGEPIPGLYAAGNASASPFGYAYPGGGATIGAATTFGFIAGNYAGEAYRRQGAGTA